MTNSELQPPPAWARIAAALTRRLPRGKSRTIDWISRGSHQRFLGKMAPQLGGYLFDCSIRDLVSKNVFFAGCYANQEIAFTRGVLKPGMNFIDVGAHWGLFTLAASYLVEETGRVIALEPDPRSFAKLGFNIECNKLRNVTRLEIAASDRDSELWLAAAETPGEDWSFTSLAQDSSRAESLFKARSRRVDEVMKEVGLPHVDLVKIDVEGAEDLVLTGMEAGLARGSYHRILLEVHRPQLAQRSRTVADLFGLLTSKGYKGYGLDCSEQACRKAYYDPWRDFAEYILPLERVASGSNPHTVWLAPGIAAERGML